MSVSGFVRVQVSTAAVHIVLIISGFFKLRGGGRDWLVLSLSLGLGYALAAG